MVAPQVNAFPPQAIQSPLDNIDPELHAVATLAAVQVDASYGQATHALPMNEYPAEHPVGVKMSVQVATFKPQGKQSAVAK